VGVLLCPEDLGELADRRALRRQPRTIRSRKYRRQWFAREVAALLTLEPLPGTGYKRTRPCFLQFLMVSNRDQTFRFANNNALTFVEHELVLPA
jgi:hypothetical protein